MWKYLLGNLQNTSSDCEWSGNLFSVTGNKWKRPTESEKGSQKDESILIKENSSNFAALVKQET